MNVLDFDLNLLAVFDAIHREKHVSRAAERVGLSQPAMSNALKRLRDALGDPLFIKSKNGVTPTPYAAEIAPAVSEALRIIGDGLKHAAHFEPATTERTFRLSMSDVAEISILPDIIDVCRRSAPEIRVETLTLTKETVQVELERGVCDLAIGFLPDVPDAAYQQTLFTTDYVCIARANHPSINGVLSADQFANAEHITVPADFTGHAAVPQALEALGLRISIKAPHFLALPFIVAHTDCLAIVPRPLARRAASTTDITIHPAPIDLPAVDVRIFWHERADKDPANQWLRTTLRAALLQANWDQQTDGVLDAID